MTLRGHKYGIKAVDLKFDVLVSVGDENDKGLIVWDVSNAGARIISANLMKKSVINSVGFIDIPNS